MTDAAAARLQGPATRVLRHAADQRPASRQLSRRAAEVGALQDELRVHLLRRRSARDHRRIPIRRRSRAAAREVAAAYIAAGVDPKRSIIFVQSAVREHTELDLDLQLRRAHGLARAHDAVQGQSRQARRAHERRPVRLSRAAWPPTSSSTKARTCRSAKTRSSTSSSSRDIAQKFNNDFNAPGFFPLPEPLIQGPGRADHELARRHEENVEVRSLRHVAHQHDRRRRHDHAEDQEGDHRSACLCPRVEEGLKGRAEVENLVGIFAAVTERSVEDVLERIRRQRLWRVQAGAGGSARRQARADRRRDAPPQRRSRRARRHPEGRRRESARHRRSRSWPRCATSSASGALDAQARD